MYRSLLPMINTTPSEVETSADGALLKRGRPRLLLQTDTPEGKVWRVIARLTRDGNYRLGVREVAQRAGCSKSAAQRTQAWKHYEKSPNRIKSAPTAADTISKRKNVLYQRRLDIVEGRIWELFVFYLARKLDKGFEGLTIRRLASLTGFPRATIGKTQAWTKFAGISGRRRRASQKARKRN